MRISEVDANEREKKKQKEKDRTPKLRFDPSVHADATLLTR